MTLQKEPFKPYKLEEERNLDELVFTVRLNIEEQLELKEAKNLLKQQKDSTALKQLAKVGFKCITSPEIKQILETILNNKRKNERVGLTEL